jgi:hypothetical protein
VKGENKLDGVHDAQRLKELQSLDLIRKIMITQTRIMEWYQKFNGNVYVSFSGGKDSTVLLHIARQMFPDIPAVFSNTGLEYYEIQRFAKQHDNVAFIAPKIRFDQVVSTFGYPLISKEVAEAIYYARRINSQSVQVERERAEPKSGESATNCLAQGAGTSRKQTDWKRLEMRWGGEGNQHLIQTGTARNRRTVLQGRWENQCAGGTNSTGTRRKTRRSTGKDEPG